jgi:calcium binding protein 39
MEFEERRPERGLEALVQQMSSFEAPSSSQSKDRDLVSALTTVSRILLGASEGTQDGAAASSSSSSSSSSSLDSQHMSILTLTRLLKSSGVVIRLIESIGQLSVEVRKEVTNVFKALMRRNPEGFVDYVAQEQTHVIDALWSGCEEGDGDAALDCGAMLRGLVRHACLTQVVLQRPSFWSLLDTHIHQEGFERCADAFTTLVEIVMGPHETLVATFLYSNLDAFFTKYEGLLLSANYMTRRRSLKLLGELLLRKSNVDVMRRFIEKKHFLKVIMLLLRDKSSSIQFEAFHVFKLFVANPTKHADVEEVLMRNRDKLVSYLETFQEGTGDAQVAREKELLLKVLSALPQINDPVPAPTLAVP